MSTEAKKRTPMPPRAKKVMFFVFVMVVFVMVGVYFSQKTKEASLPAEMQSSSLSPINGERRETAALDTPEMRDRVIKADNKMARESQDAGITSLQPVEEQGGQAEVVGFNEIDKRQIYDINGQPVQSAAEKPMEISQVSRPLTEQELLDLQGRRSALRARMEELAGRAKIYEASLMQNGNGRILVAIPPTTGADMLDRNNGMNAPAAEPKPSIRAGEMYPGSLDMNGDTDAPGIMRATILAGEHAGVAILGAVSSNATGDRLSINFNRGAFKKKTVAISAIALTADASSQDVATFVDNKYFERFILSPLSAAADSVASTLTQKPTSTSISVGGAVTQSNTGLSSADVARIAAARALKEMASTTDVSKKPVAYVSPTGKSNKLITIMFLEDVFIN